MAQLVVRNLPDDVKERLKRRAERHGHSLEAEVRAVLVQATAVPEPSKDASIGTELARKLIRHKVSDEAWDEFDNNLKELRASWRMREVDLGE